MLGQTETTSDVLEMIKAVISRSMTIDDVGELGVQAEKKAAEEGAKKVYVYHIAQALGIDVDIRKRPPNVNAARRGVDVRNPASRAEVNHG
jgi:hypothetical protein